MALSKIRNDSLADTAVHGRRNLIINGAMQVAQRGTSFAAASNQYTLDMFKLNKTSGVDEFVATVTQDTDTPDGFTTSFKVDVTTAETAIGADERVEIEQRIEAQNLQHLQYGTSNPKTLTLSFWVKSSVTGKYGINVRHHDGGKSKGLDYTVNAADTWEYKQISFTGNPSAAIDNDNYIGIWIRWSLILGTNFQNTSVENAWGSSSYWATTGLQSTWGTNASHNFWLTGVQLEVGDKSTPFEHRSYGEELASCQRYYEEGFVEWYTTVSNTGSFNPDFVGTCGFNTTKRVAPTMTVSGQTNTNCATPSLTGQVNGFETQYNITSTGIGGTQFTYKASAEL